LETPFAFVVVLNGAMSVMLTFFFLYHVYMALQNATTNERAKKSDLLMLNGNKMETLKNWSAKFGAF
jgi:hypothetical protein